MWISLFLLIPVLRPDLELISKLECDKTFWNLIRKQMTRGHGIVAERWGGPYNPPPYPTQPEGDSHTQTIITIASEMHAFPLFDSIIIDRRTDGWTIGKRLL